MLREQSLYRRWSTAARWPVGIALASLRYMWATTPVHRWEMQGVWREDRPPELPAELDREDLQQMQDGVGPMLHRTYRARISGTRLNPKELMASLFADLDRVAPSEFATFQKLGEEGPLRPGDEYVVRMPGPWDGPVRVAAADRTGFCLVTLRGHLEAGQVAFRASADHRSLHFKIEAWARSGDRLSDLLFTRLRISKEVQLHMWASVLRKVAALAEGQIEGGLVITTRRVEAAEIPAPRGRDGPPRRGRDDRRLAELARRPLNFDPRELEAHPRDPSWRFDHLVERLPHEPSDRNRPLDGQDLLLRVHYGPLRFRVGVRVGDLHEGTEEIDGREAHVAGWSYRTLAGHFEEGEMRYELWKWLDSGDVEFHLNAASRPARSGPLLPRLSFRLFGRIPQLQFYHQACRRIRRLTETQLETSRTVAARR